MQTIRPMLRPPPPNRTRFKPKAGAKSATLFAGLCVFVNLYLEARAGSETEMGAIAWLIVAPLLLVFPMLVGQNAFDTRGSQRAGDIAFAGVMVAQGLLLIVLGMMVPSKR